LLKQYRERFGLRRAVAGSRVCGFSQTGIPSLIRMRSKENEKKNLECGLYAARKIHDESISEYASQTFGSKIVT
jgi:hypothetical protein